MRGHIEAKQPRENKSQEQINLKLWKKELLNGKEAKAVKQVNVLFS